MDNREQAKEWFQATGLECFVIYDRRLDMKYYQYCGSDVIEELEKALSLLPYGKYKLVAKKNDKASLKDSLVFDLIIGDRDSQIGTQLPVLMQQPQQTGINGEEKYLEEIRRLERKNMELEYQLRLIQERQKMYNEPQMRFIERMIGFFETVAGVNQQTQQTVQSAQIAGTMEDKKKLAKKVLAIVNELSKHDPEIIDNLHRLLILAKRDPSTYQMAVNMLKQKVPNAKSS